MVLKKKKIMLCGKFFSMKDSLNIHVDVDDL